jgi:hypothetical protein
VTPKKAAELIRDVEFIALDKGLPLDLQTNFGRLLIVKRNAQARLVLEDDYGRRFAKELPPSMQVAVGKLIAQFVG